MSVYTKKGDRGKTIVLSGKGCDLVWKDDPAIDALGAIDETNSYLGVIISESEDQRLNEILRDIQRDLLTIGSIIGGSNLRFSKSKTTKLEEIIDEIEKDLPKLKNFILLGGSRVAAKLHYARALTRRAERVVVTLNKKQKVKPAVLTYLNRLSDTLFVLARNENFEVRVEEEVWDLKNK